MAPIRPSFRCRRQEAHQVLSVTRGIAGLFGFLILILVVRAERRVAAVIVPNHRPFQRSSKANPGSQASPPRHPSEAERRGRLPPIPTKEKVSSREFPQGIDLSESR
jgi:hypothetical protein